MLRPVTRGRLLWFLAALFVGGFILWLQVGLIHSIALLGFGARGFQNSLSAAVDQIAAGEFDAALADFTQVESAAQGVTRSSDTWQLRLLGGIPGVGTAVTNWQLIGSATNNVTTSTGEMLILFGDLSGKTGSEKIFRDGAIDVRQLQGLPPRVAAIDAKLGASVTDLSAINATGPAAGLLGQVQQRALKEVAPVQQAMGALVNLAPLLPDALGAQGVKRYLVVIGNQAEMRASGGAPLTLVMVEFDNGRITIPIKGQTSTQLFPPLNAPVRWWGPAKNPFFRGNPRFDPMVVTNTHPNLLYSAQEMAGAWEGGNYPRVDGVITLDLTAIAAMLNAIGPIQSPTYGEVTGDQLGQILLVDAYAEFGQDEAQVRQLANQQLLDDLLARLLSGDDLVSVARAVATTAPGRHFQVWMREPALEQLALSSGAAGQVFDPGVGDWSAIFTQNGNQSKVDVFQQRNVLVTVQLAEDGSARVSQQITMTNATPADRPEGPPERIGYETSWAKNAYLLYIPNSATNFSSSYPQGFTVRPFRGHQQYGRGFADDGFGQRFIRVVGWTKPGGQAVVSVAYELPAGTFTDSMTQGLTYILQAEPQSLFVDGTLTVRVTGPAGWTPVAERGMQVQGQNAEVSAIQNAPIQVRIEFRRS